MNHISLTTWTVLVVLCAIGVVPDTHASPANPIVMADQVKPPRAQRDGGLTFKRSANGNSGSVQMPLKRHSAHAIHRRNPEQLKSWALRQKKYVTAKWGEAFADKTVKKHLKRGTAALTDVGADTYYYAQIEVGTPAQTLNVVLDTGSSDLWLPTSSCTSSSCKGLTLYDPTSSSTYQSSSQKFSITYGSGAVTGTACADTVSMAGYTVFSQSFNIAKQVASGSISSPASGLWGFGFQELSTAGITPWWQVLVKQSKLTLNLFSFQLVRDTSTQDGNSTTGVAGGIFTIGELDTDQYEGSINYVAIPSAYQKYGYWSIPLDSYSFSTTGSAGSQVSVGEIAVIDTGTTLIATTYEFAEAFYAQISGSESLAQELGEEGLYGFPCSTDISLTLTFGGVNYPLSSTDFNAGAIDSKGETCLGAIFGSSNSGSSTPPFIVGDSFLKNVFAVFYADTPSVGFASLKDGTAQTIATSTASATATAITAAVTPRQFGGPGFGGPYGGGGGHGGNSASSSTSDTFTSVSVSNIAATGTGIYWASGVASPTASGASVLAQKLASSGGAAAPQAAWALALATTLSAGAWTLATCIFL